MKAMNQRHQSVILVLLQLHKRRNEVEAPFKKMNKRLRAFHIILRLETHLMMNRPQINKHMWQGFMIKSIQDQQMTISHLYPVLKG